MDLGPCFIQILIYILKSFIAKRLNSILVNLRFKLLKYKENNKKMCNTFVHNFKNILLYIMRKVSLERYYFVLYDCALTSKISKMALKSFCDKTLQLYILYIYIYYLSIYLSIYKSSFPKGVRSILESSEKNDVF